MSRRQDLAHFAPALLALMFFLSSLGQVSAARAREVGLAEMIDRAGKIFYGECVDRSVVENPDGRPHTTYVFRVLRGVKGVDAKQVTFSVTGAPDGRGFIGMPIYAIGDRRLLLLFPESSKGLTSPIGLDQGSFRLLRNQHGEDLVINGRGNRGLFRDVSPQTLRSRGLDRKTGEALLLRDIEQLIDSLQRKAGP